MGSRKKLRALEKRRSERFATRQGQQELLYRPPKRTACRERVFVTFVDDEATLRLEVRRWFYGTPSRMVDFYAVVQAVSYDQETGTQKLKDVASVDCRNHGTIHLHNEIDDPEHIERHDLFELTGLEQVGHLYEKSIDELIDYAASLNRRGGVS